MALQINSQPKEGENMAGLSAEVRVYRTVDGELVRENDPRGAYLAYSVGDTVADAEADAYGDVLGGVRSGHEVPGLMHDKLATTAADAARVVASAPDGPAADVAKDALAKAAKIVDAGDIPAPTLVNEPPSEILRKAALGDDRPVTDIAVYRTDDGRLVAEGHADAATLAYGKGDRVEKTDQDAFADLTPVDDQVAPKTAKKATTPANKAAVKPEDK